MNKNFILIVTIITFLGSGCKSPKAVADLTNDDIQFTLSRGSCFGKCPVYNLAVYSNGHAKLERVRFMKTPGKYERMLAKNEFNTLKSAFKKSDFEAFETEYPSDIADLPTITIGFNDGKGLKKVKGKQERPAKLMELQYIMEKMVDHPDWKLVEAYPEEDLVSEPKAKEEDNFIYEEIIIQPNPGVRLPVWFKEKELYGIRLLTRVSQEQNLWLITYNTRDFKPEEIMAMLKADKDILSAEFNKALESRDK